MKKIVIFAIVSLVYIVSLVFVGCTTSYVSTGDKEIPEIKSAQDVFNCQITEYRDAIEDLQGDNEYLLMTDPKSPAIATNDSLISLYQNKIDNLEIIADDFLSRSAGKDKKTRIELKGFDPREVAEAYVLVRYADNIGNNAVKGNLPTSGMIGIVINTRNEKIIARVEGPLFEQEFLLKPLGRQIFDVPLPGTYHVTFTSSRNSKNKGWTVKTVSPSAIYQDEDGTKYNLMATVTTRF